MTDEAGGAQSALEPAITKVEVRIIDVRKDFGTWPFGSFRRIGGGSRKYAN